MSDNRKAFLDMLAFSEIGPALLAVSDNGYNVCVGSTPKAPILFDSYAAHPMRHDAATNSNAAGRYQLMGRYYNVYRAQLGLHDFSPASQDAIALQQIRECRALPNIDAGNIPTAINQCAHIWASLPGAGYNQHENKMNDLLAAFRNSIVAQG